MSDNYSESDFESLDDYLSSPVESPSDDAVVAESRSDPTDLDDGQSSEAVEQVAPDDAVDQPDLELSDVDLEAEDSFSDAPEAATVDASMWDSPDNPYLEKARFADAIHEAAAKQQREAAEKERHDRHVDAVRRLAEGAVDLDDIPILANDLIADIQKTAMEPLQTEIDQIMHSFSATVASLRNVLTPEQYQAVVQDTERTRALGSTAAEIERAFEIQQSIKQQSTAENERLQKKIRNLTAQLAAKTITESGANRSESSAVGGGTDEPTDLDAYLSGGRL